MRELRSKLAAESTIQRTAYPFRVEIHPPTPMIRCIATARLCRRTLAGKNRPEHAAINRDRHCNVFKGSTPYLRRRLGRPVRILTSRIPRAMKDTQCVGIQAPSDETRLD